jgi:hypothetical protein
LGLKRPSATRTAQFQELCDRVHAATKDIAYAGGFSIIGINYDFWALNQRIHIAAVDANGSALTTGWEAIGAVLTNVELDYESRITTCTFNSDQLQFLKVDPEALKEELKIDAQQFRRDYGPQVTLSFNGVKSTFFVGGGGTGNQDSTDNPNASGPTPNPFDIFQAPTVQDFRSKQTGQGLQNWAHGIGGHN